MRSTSFRDLFQAFESVSIFFGQPPFAHRKVHRLAVGSKILGAGGDGLFHNTRQDLSRRWRDCAFAEDGPFVCS
jgi:hypothetical protein